MAAMGEPAYLKDLSRKAIRWIRTHPAESLRLFTLHTFYYWFPPGADYYNWRSSPGMRVYTVVRSLLTLFALAGWIVMLRVRREAAIHLGVILVMFPLSYYVVNWSSRYRAPMEWVLVLLAAVSIARLLEVVFRLRGPAAARALE
jgi:hypothetical protein